MFPVSSSGVLGTLGRRFRLTRPEVSLKHQNFVLVCGGKQYCAMLSIIQAVTYHFGLLITTGGEILVHYV